MILFISMFVIWVVIAIIASIIELHTQQQFGFALAIASTGAIIAHALAPRGINYLWIELTVFIVIWATLWILLFGFHKKIKNKFHDKEDGFFAYIDKVVIASQPNTETYGELKINDKIFRFKSNQKIAKNDRIKIIDVKGVTFYVEKVTDKE